MKTFVIASTFALSFPFAALAQDAMPTPDAETHVPDASSRITAVCSTNAVLSEKASAVCEGTTPAPSLIRDNSRFPNRGVGQEFNVLYANVTAFTDK